MKRIIISLFMLFSAVSSFALGEYSKAKAGINSLTFTKDSWSIDYRVEYIDPSAFDSVLFITNTDTASLNMSVFNNLTKVNEYSVVDNVTISEADLSKPLSLKQSGGYLSIEWYSGGTVTPFFFNIFSRIKYGTEPGACIRAPKTGEYISFDNDWVNGCAFSICNDLSCSFQMSGKIYNADGTLLKTVQTVVSYGETGYSTDSEGNYVMNLSVDTIKSISSIAIVSSRTYAIETITIDGNPGDVINQDIHLKDMYLSENEVRNSETAMFFTYPNPAAKEIHFSYRILAALSDCTIDIFSNEGMLVGHLPISQQEGDVPCLLGDSFPAGSYTYSVSNNKTVIYRGRFFVQ